MEVSGSDQAAEEEPVVPSVEVDVEVDTFSVDFQAELARFVRPPPPRSRSRSPVRSPSSPSVPPGVHTTHPVTCVICRVSWFETKIANFYFDAAQPPPVDGSPQPQLATRTPAVVPQRLWVKAPPPEEAAKAPPPKEATVRGPPTMSWGPRPPKYPPPPHLLPQPTAPVIPRRQLDQSPQSKCGLPPPVGEELVNSSCRLDLLLSGDIPLDNGLLEIISLDRRIAVLREAAAHEAAEHEEAHGEADVSEWQVDEEF